MKRLFLIGCPRSGSTWTMFLMAQHPNVVVCQHNRLFDGLTGFREWFERQQRPGKEDSSRFGMSVVMPGEDDSVASFKGILPEDEFYSICRHAASTIYDRIGSNKAGAEIVVDKTPENARQADFILKVFPDAYFLHILRDPRAVTSSLVAASKSFEDRFPPRPLGAARLWRHDTIKAREVGKLTDRYLEVRYETLKANGAAEVQRMFQWLGLPADLELCEKAVEASKIDRMKKITSAHKGFFRKGETDSWKSDLKSSDVQIIEYIAAELMEELGYERQFPRSDKKPLAMTMEEARRGIGNGIRGIKRAIVPR